MTSAPKYQGFLRLSNIGKAASGVGSAIKSGIRTITPTNFSSAFSSAGSRQYLSPVGIGQDLMMNTKKGSDLYNFLTKVQNERKSYQNLAARNEEIVPNLFSEVGFPEEAAYLSNLGFFNVNRPSYASAIDRYTGIGNLAMNTAFDDGKFPHKRGLLSLTPNELIKAKQRANNLDEFISSGIGGKTNRPITLYRKSADESKRVLNTKDNSITLKRLSDLKPGDIILETNFVSYFDSDRPLYGGLYGIEHHRNPITQQTEFFPGVSFGIPTLHGNDLNFLEEAESIGNRFGFRKFIGKDSDKHLNFEFMGGFKDGGTAPKYQGLVGGALRAGRTGRNLVRSGANALKGFAPAIDFAATTFVGAPTGMFTNMGRFADVIRPNYTAPTEDQVYKLNPSRNTLTRFSTIGSLFKKPGTRHSYLPFTRTGRANILKRYYDAIGYKPPYMGFKRDFVARDYQSPGFLEESPSISPSTVFERYRNPATFTTVGKALPRTSDFFVRSSNPKNPKLFGTEGTTSRQQALRSNTFLVNQGVTNKPFVFLHGASSSALPSISRFGGLVPTGQLLERGGAPFSGSLQVLNRWKGEHADHQNKNHISLASITSPLTPISYAFNKPLKGNFVEQYNDFLRGEGPYGYKTISTYKDAPIKEMLERRIANFQNAPAAEQELILDNFPVVFGLNPINNSMGATRYRLGKSRYDLAPSLGGGATFDEMAAAFVPRNRIDVTRQYLPGVDVMPLEQFLINMPLMHKYTFGPKLGNKSLEHSQKFRSWYLYNLEKDRLASPQGRYHPEFFRQNGGTTPKYQGLVGGALRAGRQLSLFPKVVKPLISPITTTQNLGKQLSFNFNAPPIAAQIYNQPLTFNAPNLTNISGARDLSFIMEAPVDSDFGKFRQKLYDSRTSNYKPSGDPEYLNFMENKQPNSLGRYSDAQIKQDFDYLTGLGLRDYNTRAGQIALEDYATRRSKLYNTAFSDFKYSPDGSTMYMKSPEDWRRRLELTDPSYQDVLQQLRERVNTLDLSFDPNIVGKTSSPLILHRGTRGDMVNVVDPSNFSIKLKKLSEVGDDEIFFSTGFTSTSDPAMPTFWGPTAYNAFGKKSSDHLRIYNPSGSTVLSPALHMTDIQWPGEGEILLPRFSFFQKAKSFPFKASNLESSNEISGGAFDFRPPTMDLINLGFIRKEGGEITKHQQTITPNFVSLRDTPKAASGNRRRRLKSNTNPFAV